MTRQSLVLFSVLAILAAACSGDPQERTNLAHDRRHAAIVAELDALLPALGMQGRNREAMQARSTQ